MMRAKAHFKRRAPGEMNKLEAAYAEHLNAEQAAGRVAFWWFERIKFKLATKTWFSPDFVVIYPDATVELHETKGWMQEDANVKLKVAADLFPFPFRLVRQKAKRDGGGFEITRVP